MQHCASDAVGVRKAPLRTPTTKPPPAATHPPQVAKAYKTLTSPGHKTVAHTHQTPRASMVALARRASWTQSHSPRYMGWLLGTVAVASVAAIIFYAYIVYRAVKQRRSPSEVPPSVILDPQMWQVWIPNKRATPRDGVLREERWRVSSMSVLLNALHAEQSW